MELELVVVELVVWASTTGAILNLKDFKAPRCCFKTQFEPRRQLEFS